jgi:integrase
MKGGMMRQATERVNFTKKYLEKLSADDKRRTVYDTRIPGLGILVQPKGSHKSFFWFRKVRGVGQWKTIGDFPALSVEQGRARAQDHNTKLEGWKNKDYEGTNPFERKPNPTLGDVFDEYVENALKKNSTNPDKAVKGTRWMFERYLKSWRNRHISSIKRNDVKKFHTAAMNTYGGVTANRLVTFLRTLFYYAQEGMDWKGDNPARNPGKKGSKILVDEASRETFIKAEEMPGFLDTLRKETNVDLRDFVIIALFTAARSGDVLAMRWDQVSQDEWIVPNRKKPKNPYVAPLHEEVLDLLKERRKSAGNLPWVFPSNGATGHIVSVKRGWKQFLKRAKLTNLRIHDLRRTNATWQIKQGASLFVAGKSLGHASIKSMEPYARLETSSVKESQEGAVRAMLAAKENPKSLKR